MKQAMADFVEVVFGFRKFILMVFILLVSIIFRIKGQISGQEFVDLLKNTVLGFFAANGFEHASLTVQEYFKAKSPDASKDA